MAGISFVANDCAHNCADDRLDDCLNEHLDDLADKNPQTSASNEWFASVTSAITSEISLDSKIAATAPTTPTNEILPTNEIPKQARVINELTILREQSEQAKSVAKSLNGSLSREDSNAGALPSATNKAHTTNKSHKPLYIAPLRRPFDRTYARIASDKSISHRFAMLSMLSDKPSYARGYLLANDTLDSLRIASALGQDVRIDGNDVAIYPRQISKAPASELYCGNSGTSMRIFMGLLSGIDGGRYVLRGDEYLNARPMKRIINPLLSCGASISATSKGGELCAPISVHGRKLEYFSYTDTIGSAQVKSALILAGLLGSGARIIEQVPSRNHTENMLLSMNAPLRIDGGVIEVGKLSSPLEPLDLSVPNDPSSGVFLAVAAAITGSRVVLQNMLLNDTRIGAYKVLARMGAHVDIQKRTISGGEMVGDIIVRAGRLRGVEIADDIASMIDELPALSIAMACADGVSVVKNARELRVKETDRIKAVVDNLRAIGVECSELDDGYIIRGKFGFAAKAQPTSEISFDSKTTATAPTTPTSEICQTSASNERLNNSAATSEISFDDKFGAITTTAPTSEILPTSEICQTSASNAAMIECRGDHRIAMSFAVMGLVCGCLIDEPECVGVSFAEFFDVIRGLYAD